MRNTKNRKLIFYLVLVSLFIFIEEEELSDESKKNKKIAQVEIEQRELSKIHSEKASLGEFEIDYNELPLYEDIDKLSVYEVHDTPEIVLRAGELIGKIQEEGEKQTKKRKDALGFFKKCAEDDRIIPSIRALCLSKVYKLIPHWKEVVPLESSLISQEVEELAIKLF